MCLKFQGNEAKANGSSSGNSRMLIQRAGRFGETILYNIQKQDARPVSKTNLHL